MDKKQMKKGSVLVFALVILSILLVSAIAIITVAVVEKRSALETQKSVLAFQAADSGAERVIKRIYVNDSPTLALIPLNGDIGAAGGDSTLNALAAALGANTNNPNCVAVSKYITGANDQAEPNYTFQLTFYDQNGVKIACNDNQWRDKIVKIKSEGFFRATSRVIEIGIRPRI